MPPKKRVAVGVSKPAAVAASSKKTIPTAKSPAVTAVAKATPTAAAAAVDAEKTIRLRVEKFSKMKEAVESEVKEIGGFPWQLQMSPSDHPLRAPILELVCLYSREARVWHCKAERKWRVMDVKGEMQPIQETGRNDLYTASKPGQSTFAVMDAVKRESKKYVKSDTVVIEVEITVEKEAGDRFRKKLPIDFLTASEMFDGEVEVGGKKVHVNKQFLSMHSPIFKGHFYGDSTVKLEEGDLQAMLDFLRMLYRTEGSVTAATAEGVLQMADKFKVQVLVDHTEKWMYSATDVKTSEKIRLAEKHNLPTLLKGGLREVERDDTAREEVKKSEAFKNYSATTKKALNATFKKARVTANRRMMDEDDSDDLGYDFW